ncbi:42620_t:CDS:1, partial [Gigaspora margarita]
MSNHKYTDWFLRNSKDPLTLNYEIWLMREFQSEAPPTDSTEAFNRWSRGINEAINSLNTEAQKNLKQAKEVALKLGVKK